MNHSVPVLLTSLSFHRGTFSPFRKCDRRCFCTSYYQIVLQKFLWGCFGWEKICLNSYRIIYSRVLKTILLTDWLPSFHDQARLSCTGHYLMGANHSTGNGHGDSDRGVSSSKPKTCYYELLGVEAKASEDE